MHIGADAKSIRVAKGIKLARRQFRRKKGR